MDFELIQGGSVIGFLPLTDAAREWLDDNVQAEPYQYLGKVLYVEHRFADDIVHGILAAGLSIN